METAVVVAQDAPLVATATHPKEAVGDTIETIVEIGSLFSDSRKVRQAKSHPGE